MSQMRSPLGVALCFRQFADVVRDRERGGQSRGFYSEQIDQAADAMILRPLDDEVLCRNRWWDDLRPNSRIARHQRAIRQRRPVAPDRRVEPLRSRRIDGIIDLLDPLHIGPKPGLSRHVEREMDTKPAGPRHWIDQVRKWRPRAAAEVISFGKIGLRYQLDRHAFNATRDCR